MTTAAKAVARKRTGKAGIGPVETEDGQEARPVVPGSNADTGNVTALQLTPENAPDEESEEEEIAVAKVEKGMVLMNFVKAIPTRDKRNNDRFVSLHFSAILSPEGAGLFSDKVSARFELMMDDKGLTDLHVHDLPIQMLDLARAEDGKNVLHEPVEPSKVGLAVIESKGSGETVKGIRLSFVAPIKQRDEVLLWAGAHHGELVWVKMGDSQRKLKS